jgi:hypothetical protein
MQSSFVLQHLEIRNSKFETSIHVDIESASSTCKTSFQHNVVGVHVHAEPMLMNWIEGADTGVLCFAFGACVWGDTRGGLLGGTARAQASAAPTPTPSLVHHLHALHKLHPTSSANDACDYCKVNYTSQQRFGGRARV